MRKMLRSQASPGGLAKSTATCMAIAVVGYEHGTNPGPTIGELRVDAASGPESKWNARVGQIFVDDFCATDYPEATGKGFTDVLSEFQALFPTVSVDLAVAAGFENLESYRQFSRSFTKRLRANWKAESRLGAATRLNDPHRFVPIVRKLVEDDGMSCDEEDTDGHAHPVPSTWRSVSATRWLQSLDGPSIRSHSSTFRKAHADVVREPTESRVPRSLPVNFYNPTYLRTLDGVQYADLDPRSAVDIGF